MIFPSRRALSHSAPISACYNSISYQLIYVYDYSANGAVRQLDVAIDPFGKRTTLRNVMSLRQFPRRSYKVQTTSSPVHT